MSSTSQFESFHSEKHSGKLLQEMYGLYQRQQLCDVTIKGKDTGIGIFAHSVVLASMSTYFSDNIHVISNNTSIFHLSDMEHQSLKVLIDFCYTGTLHFQYETLDDVLKTAKLLEMESVFEACDREFLKQLSTDNCLKALSISCEYNCKNLLVSAIAMSCKYFAQLSENKDYFNLTIEGLEMLLKRDDLIVPSEELLVFKILKWIEYDLGNRQQHVTRLMHCIRYCFLSTEFIVQNIQPMCTPSEDAVILLNNIIHWLYVRENRSSLNWICTRPRQYQQNQIREFSVNSEGTNTRESEKELLLVLSTISNKVAPIIEIYRSRAEKWERCMNDNQGLKISISYGTTLLGTEVVVAGGAAKDHILHSLNLKTMKWSAMPKLQTARAYFGIANWSGFLYALGGYGNNWNTLCSVERLDARSNKWVYVKEMCAKRSSHGIAVMNNKIFAIGGSNDAGETLASVESYDIVLNCWTKKAAMHSKRKNPAVGVYKQDIYVFGGFDGKQELSSAERYNCIENVWTEIAPMSVARSSFSCPLWNNSFVLVGGCNSNKKDIQIAERYVPNSNGYFEMPKPIYHSNNSIQAITVPNIIHNSNIN